MKSFLTFSLLCAAVVLSTKGQKIDSEFNMNSSQLIQSKGIDCQEHDVTTTDGYILGIHRLTQESSNEYPVLIIHGFLSNSETFLINLRNQSLAYVLHDRGFDVWLGNVRGNKYSRQHETLNPADSQFWDWSFDEMGEFDVPAMIDHILSTTGQSKINVITYSQGSAVFMAAVMRHGSTVGEKINQHFALAPGVYYPNMKSNIVKAWPKVEKQLTAKGDGEFFHISPTMARFYAKLCMKFPVQCVDKISRLGGYNHDHMNATRLPLYLSIYDASSNQNLLHTGQQLEQKEGLRYFDYKNADLNMLHYNTPHPPRYNIDNFNVPTSVFCGSIDTFVVTEDCEKLANRLPNLVKLSVIDGYSHQSFTLATNAVSEVYEPIMNAMNNRA